MSTLFVGNFDFEHRLTDADAGLAESAGVRRIAAELSCVWLTIAETGDRILVPDAFEPGFFEEAAAQGLPAVVGVRTPAEAGGVTRFVPWGWTDDVRRIARTCGVGDVGPAAEAVRAVNARSFSAALEREREVGIRGAALVRSLDELQSAVNAAVRTSAGFEDRWVVKSEFGMSARERTLGRGPVVSEPVRRWVETRLRRHGVVHFEPWVERIEEAGLQFTIPPDEPIRYEGATPLLTDANGGYRGSRFAIDADEEVNWMPAMDAAIHAVTRARRLGYFGPIGIDAMRYRTADGVERMRCVQDVNARHTMGRLALGLQRLLGPGECGTWLHLRWPGRSPDEIRTWLAAIGERLPRPVRIVRTSPLSVGGRTTSLATLAVIAPDRPTLEIAERTLLAANDSRD